jgi:hypothetical protein
MNWTRYTKYQKIEVTYVILCIKLTVISSNIIILLEFEMCYVLVIYFLFVNLYYTLGYGNFNVQNSLILVQKRCVAALREAIFACRRPYLIIIYKI